MAGYIEDRWLNKRPNPETNKRERTERYGKGKRYRVAGIPGVRDASFATLEDAKTWKSTAETDTRRLTWMDPREGEMTLREYVETIWWPGRSDPTNTAGPMQSKIWNHILDPIGGLQLRQIDEEVLRLWLKGRREQAKLGEGTLEVVWIHLGSILGSTVGKRLAANPCRAHGHLRPIGGGSSTARAWSAREFVEIREQMRERYRITADLGLHAGLRQAEMIGIGLDDIDEDAMVIRLRRQLLWANGTRPYFKLPKGRKERLIPLSPGLLQLIREHVERFPPVETKLPWEGPGNGKRETATAHLLVTTQWRHRLNPSGYNQRILKPALAAAGLIPAKGEEGWGWSGTREEMYHRFRHTYASVQLRTEAPVAVSKWMGHASPEITLRVYAHFIPEDAQRGRAAVDNWLSAGSRQNSPDSPQEPH
ncbi:tyrosine-type recombinase/integrase [Kitasatospora fiedleri]|uniref:tyrosine-type recombinase/integrase n=1 Tax=Kitasatospora fiedleri TaxID=2991545 RepID=UPI00249BDC17|nr:tyrosine-type recombinase/integrase [Kitasatospora fiedleri]